MSGPMSDVDPIPVFSFPTSWSHGRGLAGRAGTVLGELGCRDPLVLTDGLLLSLGVVEPVLDSLRAAGIDYTICDAVNYEPTVDLFDSIIDRLDLKKFDAVVAVGGGSVLDVAKGLAVIGSFGGHIRDYAGFDKVPGVPPIKVVTVPTTSGTGSEISDGVVLIDEARKTKFLVISKKICPTVALTDPLMTVSMPPRVTAFSGTDALVHATESYISKGAGPATELFALRAIELLCRNIRAACDNGGDLDVRERMQIGATMAMSAGMNSKLGLCHAMAMPLCALYHMPHGQAVGMALPVVLAYNAPAVGAKMEAVFQAMGFADDGFARLEALLKEIGVLARLGDMGFQESHMPTIVNETMNSAQRPTNPRDPTPEDIAAIVRRML
ncbi:MAG: iron-containing alcohol dehydrogenase [Actinomycetia bacterium]|nr:iron-containing alcohol dehydrogenase [Actinomycetes bacterium]